MLHPLTRSLAPASLVLRKFDEREVLCTSNLDVIALTRAVMLGTSPGRRLSISTAAAARQAVDSASAIAASTCASSLVCQPRPLAPQLLQRPFSAATRPHKT